MSRINRPTFRDRVKDLRRVRAGDLLEHPLNWRTHPRRQREALRAVLEKVGFADALIAREDKGLLRLIDGHLRRDIDPEQIVPVLVLDVNEEEAELLLATLDPLTELAGANPDALSDLLSRVDASSEELRQLFAELTTRAGPAAGLVEPDDIPSTPTTPRSRPGDVWELDGHRVACGDARDEALIARLIGGESARVLLTDPPYGVSYQGKGRSRLRLANDDQGGVAALLAEAFAAADPALAPGGAVYLFHPAGPGTVAFLAALTARWSLKQVLVWRKDAMVLGHADYHFAHEPIAYGKKPGPGRWGRGGSGWYGGHAESSVIEVPRPKASLEHPTQKPVELLRRLIGNSSAANDVVLDPFLGSGSTLIAAEQLGRRCFGVEIDPRYTDVAVRRWERFTGRKATKERRSRGR